MPVHIRGKLNIVIAVTIQFVAWGLLMLASSVSVWWSIPIGIIFSFLLLTNYALMHDAAHRTLLRSRRMNDVFGILTSALFPKSFTMFEVTHHMHHRQNRTDREMFDYYYPNDNMWIKNIQWYGILTGLHYLVVPLGSLLMALVPWLFQTRLFTGSRTSGILFREFKGKIVWRVRGEVLFIILLWASMWVLLDLHWQSVLIFYACFGFNWATRQYVSHAWTPRDVIEGAANLRVSKLLGLILLNGQWDHPHHKFPYLPWTELSNPRYHEREPISYWRQYLSLWKGMRPNFEKAPLPILDIDIHPEITYV